jgi:hypothetical protein
MNLQNLGLRLHHAGERVFFVLPINEQQSRTPSIDLRIESQLNIDFLFRDRRIGCRYAANQDRMGRCGIRARPKQSSK